MNKLENQHTLNLLRRTSSLDSCGVKNCGSTHRVGQTRYRSDTDIRIRKSGSPCPSDQNKYVVFCCEKGGQLFQEVTRECLTGHSHTRRHSSVERCRHRSPSPSEGDALSVSRSCRSKSRSRDHRCCDRDKSTSHTFNTENRRDKSAQRRGSPKRRSPSRLRSKSRDSGGFFDKPDVITTEIVRQPEEKTILCTETDQSGISFDIDPMYRPIYSGTIYDSKTTNQNRGKRMELSDERTDKIPGKTAAMKEALVKSLYDQYLKDMKRLGAKAKNTEYSIRAPGLCGKFVHGSGNQGIIITDPSIGLNKQAGHGNSTRESSPRRSVKKHRNKSIETGSACQHDKEKEIRISSPDRHKHQSILKSSSQQTRPRTERSVSRGKTCDSEGSTLKRSNSPASRSPGRSSRENSRPRQGKQPPQSSVRGDKLINRSHHEQETESSTHASRAARSHTQSPNRQRTSINRNVERQSQNKKPKSRSTTPNSRSRQTRATKQPTGALYMKYEHAPPNLQYNGRNFQSSVGGYTNVYNQCIDNIPPFVNSEWNNSIGQEKPPYDMQTNNHFQYQPENNHKKQENINSQQISSRTLKCVDNNRFREYRTSVANQQFSEKQPNANFVSHTYNANLIHSNVKQVPQEHIEIGLNVQHTGRNELQNSQLHKSFENTQFCDYQNTNIQNINKPPYPNPRNQNINASKEYNIPFPEPQFYEVRNPQFLNVHQMEKENIFNSPNPYRRQAHTSPRHNLVMCDATISNSEFIQREPTQFTQPCNRAEQRTLLPPPQIPINGNIPVESGPTVNRKREVTFSDQQLINTGFSGNQHIQSFPAPIQGSSNSHSINGQAFQHNDDRQGIQDKVLTNTQCSTTPPNQFMQLNELTNKTSTYSESHTFLKHTHTPQFHVQNNNSNNFQSLTVPQFTKTNMSQNPANGSNENVIKVSSSVDRKRQVPQVPKDNGPLYSGQPPSPAQWDNMTTIQHCEHKQSVNQSGSGQSCTSNTFQGNKPTEYTAQYSEAQHTGKGFIENPAQNQDKPTVPSQNMDSNLSNPVQHGFPVPNQAYFNANLVDCSTANNAVQYSQNVSNDHGRDEKHRLNPDSKNEFYKHTNGQQFINGNTLSLSNANIFIHQANVSPQLQENTFEKSNNCPKPNYNTNLNDFSSESSCNNGNIQHHTSIKHDIQYQPKHETQDATSKLLHYPDELHSRLQISESSSNPPTRHSSHVFESYSIPEPHPASCYPLETNNVAQQGHLTSHLHNGDREPVVVSKQSFTSQQRQQSSSPQRINERPIQNPEMSISVEQGRQTRGNQFQTDTVNDPNIQYPLRQSDITRFAATLPQSPAYHNSAIGHWKPNTTNFSNGGDINDMVNVQNKLERAFYESDRPIFSLQKPPYAEKYVHPEEGNGKDINGSKTQEEFRAKTFTGNFRQMESPTIRSLNEASQKQETFYINNEQTRSCDVKNKCYLNAQHIYHVSPFNCGAYPQTLDEKCVYQHPSVKRKTHTNSQNVQQYCAVDTFSAREDMYNKETRVPIDLQSNQEDKSCDSDYDIGNLNPDLLYRALKRLIQEQELIASSTQKELKKKSEILDVKKSAILETVQNTSKSLLSMLNELNYDEAISLLSELKTKHRTSLGLKLKEEENLNSIKQETSEETLSNQETDENPKLRKPELKAPHLETKAPEITDAQEKPRDGAINNKSTQDSNISTQEETKECKPVERSSLQEFYIIGHIRSADYLQQHKALQTCQKHDVVIKIEPVNSKHNQGNEGDASTYLDATNTAEMLSNHIGRAFPQGVTQETNNSPHCVRLQDRVNSFSVADATRQSGQQAFICTRPSQSFPRGEQVPYVNPYTNIFQQEGALQMQPNKSDFIFGGSKDYFSPCMVDSKTQSPMLYASNMVNVANSEYRVFVQSEHGNTCSNNNSSNGYNTLENQNNDHQQFQSPPPNQFQQEYSKIPRYNVRKRNQNATILKKSSHHYIVRKRMRERSVNHHIQEEPLVVNKQMHCAPPVQFGQKQQRPPTSFQIMANTSTLSQSHILNPTIVPKIASTETSQHEANNSHRPKGNLSSQSHNSTNTSGRNPFNFGQVQNDNAKVQSPSINSNKSQEPEDGVENQRNLSACDKNNAAKKIQEPHINNNLRSTTGTKNSVRSDNSEKQKRLRSDTHSILKKPPPSVKSHRRP